MRLKMSFKYDKDTLKENLSIEEVFDLVSELGGEPILKDNCIICKTICHNSDLTNASHKLYYYSNTHLFHCYTETFNFEDNQEASEDWQIINNFKRNKEKNQPQIVELKTYDNKVLRYLPHPHIIPWEAEGIAFDVMESRGICYDPMNEGVVIPHYNIDGDLIGIRERTLIKENEIYGKYRPAIINGKMYNHPLSFNIYNLNNSKENIKKLQKVIIFESEKSCLKYASYFGAENDITGAVCGSNLLNYQFSLLYNLGVKEIIIAFDRQYQKIGDEEYQIWINKLKKISQKYRNFCNISFIFDTKDLLDYKDAPIDKGKEIFLQLLQERLDADGK